jgi:transposase
MVVVGADVHKRTHTFVAVDEVGRKLGEKTVKAITAGHAEAVMWARERFGAEVVWAIEDCRHLSARLERVAGVPGLVAELARDELADITGSPRPSTPWPNGSDSACARSPRRCFPFPAVGS